MLLIDKTPLEMGMLGIAVSALVLDWKRAIGQK
jgi:hypothetical protein